MVGLSVERLAQRYVDLIYPNLFTPSIQELKNEIVSKVNSGELELAVLKDIIREFEDKNER